MNDSPENRNESRGRRGPGEHGSRNLDGRRPSTPGEHGSPALDERIGRDLNALRERSRRAQIPFRETMESLSGDGAEGRKTPWEERSMVWLRFLRTRTRLVTVGAVAVLALALLVVPISYQKVVGHEVALAVSGGGMNDELVREVAAEFKEVLETDAVNVAVHDDGNGPQYKLVAKVPTGTGSSPKAVSRAFARTLNEKGYTAEAHWTPIKEAVSGTVYAMVYDNVIHVSIDDKSADELEAEIAEALAAAGVPNAQVSVTLDGDDQVKIEVQATSEGPMDATGEGRARIVLTSGGAALGGQGEDCEVRLMRRATETGEQLIVEVTANGQTVTAIVDDPESLSDAELSGLVQEQLAAQGAGDLSVSCQDGHVQVLSAGTMAAEEDSGVRPTTWGRVKQEVGKGN
jgi:hypothetical protein